MAIANRNNPYNFNEYLDWRDQANCWQDSPFLRKAVKHYSGDQWPCIDKEMETFAPKVSQRWRKMLEVAARPENAIQMQHYDAHNNRIDKIVRPGEMEQMEQEWFSEGIFSDDTHPWMANLKMAMFLSHGEAGVNCPLACTGGLVTLLEQLADTPETLTILDHLKNGKDGVYARGAQYLSEIQGGSDVQSNCLEAVQNEDGTWRLYGDKFWCSATQCDYTVVTAKAQGSHEVGLFVVPSYLDGDEERGIRNGYTINRLKNKIGSKEMPTAELTYNGAVAYQLGELNRGIANMMQYVLSQSRLNCGLGTAVGFPQMVNEIKKYTEFRTAFGVKISDFPLLDLQIQKLEKAANRAAASIMKMVGEFTHQLIEQNSEIKDDSIEAKKRRFNLRQIIMLQKLVIASETPGHWLSAMTLLGGHGMIEDFSSFPRLFRDSATNQMWEGPRNVLLTQIYMDLVKAKSWYPADELVRNILCEAQNHVVEPLMAEIKELISHGTLMGKNEKTFEVCQRWDTFCDDLFHAYQDMAVNEVSGKILHLKQEITIIKH